MDFKENVIKLFSILALHRGAIDWPWGARLARRLLIEDLCSKRKGGSWIQRATDSLCDRHFWAVMLYVIYNKKGNCSYHFLGWSETIRILAWSTGLLHVLEGLCRTSEQSKPNRIIKLQGKRFSWSLGWKHKIRTIHNNHYIGKRREHLWIDTYLEGALYKYSITLYFIHSGLVLPVCITGSSALESFVLCYNSKYMRGVTDKAVCLSKQTP